MNKLLLGLSTSIVLAIVSCRQSEVAENRFSENDMAKLIKVMPNSSITNPTARHEISIGWDEWGRKSKDCGGWGLCNFSFHYDQTGKNATTTDSQYKSNINIDKDGQKYFYIFLNEKPNEQIPQDVLALRIDENINYNFNKINYIVKSGTYYYKNDIGLYGGYKIFVD